MALPAPTPGVRCLALGVELGAPAPAALPGPCRLHTPGHPTDVIKAAPVGPGRAEEWEPGPWSLRRSSAGKCGVSAYGALALLRRVC